jgi:predicted CoA-substrate-specific enzyme activase
MGKNYFLGIDIGSALCKAVVLNSGNNDILAKASHPIKGDPEYAAKQCITQLAKELGLFWKRSLKKNKIATGQNADKIYPDVKMSELTCIGKGAYNLNPNIEIVVDVGSFTMKAVKLKSDGEIKDFLMNNKCAAGSGVLLELVSEALEFEVQELDGIAAEAEEPIQISSQCSIFAESEVISYKNEGARIPDLVAGVCNSVAGRIYPLIRKLDKSPENIAFGGGVALNKTVVSNLEERLDLKLVELPIHPQFLAAYGAAIIAKEGENN